MIANDVLVATFMIGFISSIITGILYFYWKNNCQQQLNIHGICNDRRVTITSIILAVSIMMVFLPIMIGIKIDR